MVWFTVIVPGPSRIFRPALPNRYALLGTVGKSATSNHWLTLGSGTVPLAMRFGCVGGPLATVPSVLSGVNGLPVRSWLVPANCQPFRNILWTGDSQE